MKNEINAVLENMKATTPERSDYTSEDGLLHCGKCHKPKEAYFPEGKALFGLDRHPAECDCQRAAREEREAAEQRRRHLDTVEELKRWGFTDPTIRDWTFENDNGRNPQTELARRYVEHWEDMRTDNIGFGMERGTEYGLEQVFNVIDSRYRSGKPLIVTTNLTLDDLRNPEDTAHSRIYDRLLSMCVPVRFTSDNFRQEAAQAKLERLKKLM